MAPLTIQQAFNLAAQYHRAGQLKEAEQLYRQVLARQPAHIDAIHNLGLIAHQTGRNDVAVDLIRRAIALRPDDAEAYNNLGIALRDMGQVDEAIAAYRRGIALQPDLPESHSNLGNILNDIGQTDEAIAAYRQAISLRPNYAEAHHNLGNVLRDQGQLDEAIHAYRQANLFAPQNGEFHSKLVFTLNYHPAYTAPAIAAELTRWNQQHAEPLRKFVLPHGNDRNPDRLLKIGYVSPDFREHSNALFTVPLLEHHDHQNFQIVCYAEVPNPDDMTARIKGSADLWRSTVGLSDDQVAAQIRQDQIDILVDLTMHMPGNRLLVFARKPAPVQVTWLAYPASTGLGSIDYRLSDPYLDPPGMDESVYSERTLRLPDTFWCYEPLEGRDIPVNSLPATQAGFITFACLNNFWKVTDEVLALWSQVLGQIPNSRLLLLAPPGKSRQYNFDRLIQQGINPARVEFIPRRPRREYLQLYHRIDIGLDSFPYNGHTTSLDSFWMGVPVVTWVGERAVSRAGWCQLSNLGLAELAAQSPGQFVRLAVELAGDWPRLEELRGTLRQRMEQSPLMDAPQFARNIEAAYRQMWHDWCAAGPAPV
jgi:predicted O-linked N-acetylglucosamine transferase (SPINDLY family)